MTFAEMESWQAADLAAFFKEYAEVEKPRVYLRLTNHRYLDVK